MKVGETTDFNNSIISVKISIQQTAERLKSCMSYDT